MDTLKRELYMRAHTLLKSGRESCVCWALMETLNELGILPGMQDVDPKVRLEDFLKELFPEFFGLDDLTQWSEFLGQPSGAPRPEGIFAYWWLSNKNRIAPRLRILDCILNSH